MGLEVSLSGGFSATLDGEPWNLPRGRARLLFVYLLLHRQAPVDRSRLAGLFWADSTEEQARTNLRRELHKLKGLLPGADRFLEVTPTALAIRSQAPLKVLTDGPEPLLPEEEAEWLCACRQQHLERRLNELERAYSEAENEGDLNSALGHLRALLDLDPLREDLHRHKMRLLYARGDKAGALRAYEDCLAVLQEELGVSPSAPTRQLHQQLLEEESKPAPRVSSTLVGRDAEWGQILAWFESAQLEVSSPALLLTGEPGIGKSRLLEELVSVVRARGGTAVVGRSYEAERHRPFAPWSEAVEGFQEILERESQKGDRGRLFEALVGHLCGLPAPVVVMLDDLQWIDEASAALLHFGFRGAQLRTVCAARPAELEENPHAQPLLRSLARDGRLRRLGLGPLSPEAVLELAPAADPRRCGGNPLLALELARAESDGGQDLRQLLAVRLGRLSSQARELLSWAAALGGDFSALRLEKVCGRSLMELLSALEELERFSVLRPKGSDYDFVHDLIREAVYHELSEPRRRLLHLQIARSLDGEAHPAEVAEHAALAGEVELAARSALEGARRYCRVLAFHEAFQLAALGLEQSRRLPEPWELQLRLHQVMVTAGIPDSHEQNLRAELTRLIDNLERSGQDEHRTEAVSLLAMWDFDRQRLDSVQRRSDETATLARRGTPQKAARMLAQAGACLAAIGREMDKARALLLEAERLAERHGLEVLEILLTRGLLARFDGRAEAARECLQECVTQAWEREEIWRGIVALTHLTMLEIEAGRWPKVGRLCNELLEASKRLGPGSEGPVARCCRALAEGDEPGAEQGLEELRRVDNRRMLAFCLRQAAHRFEHWDWLEQAYQTAVAIEDLPEQALAGAALAERHLGGDRPQEARRLLLELRELPQAQLSRAALEARARLGRSWTQRGGR